MGNPGPVLPLSGWQRAHIVSAVEYMRDVARRTPGDDRARTIYEGLLEVLEPSRRMARQYRERHPMTVVGSMWDKRSGRDRRVTERRVADAGPGVAEERRRAQRRSGSERRQR